jgi:ABC-type transport system substrate-binding protein
MDVERGSMGHVRIVATAGAIVAALLVPSASGSPVAGGTFLVAGGPEGIDPALFSHTLLQPACGTLMGYPARSFPDGLRLRPELAESTPVVSRDGKTYTFTVRRDARFSTGAPVTARAFAHALARARDPALDSALATDFQGVRRVRAEGRTLTLKLKRPVPSLPALTTALCAVPPTLSADPEGAKAPLPSAAPYYVAEFVPGERIVLERNRFYKGSRAYHVDRFVADLDVVQTEMVDAVASGKFDWASVNQTTGAARAKELVRRYGVNKRQYWVAPGTGLRLFFLNTSRPLFRNNVKLRQAVNFAVDRGALARELGPYGGRPTDQYLLPVMPGFRDKWIYPVKGPDLRKARELARGRTRGGKAVLYTPSFPFPLATAQIVQRNLREIGLEVEIKTFPPAVSFQKLATPGEPFDIGYGGFFGTGTRDPSFLNLLFDGRTIGQLGFGNWSYFDSREYNRLLDQASRMTGAARYRVFGELDVQLSRDAAPAIPWAALNAIDFVSARVGCIVMNPDIDLTAVCLR